MYQQYLSYQLIHIQIDKKNQAEHDVINVTKNELQHLYEICLGGYLTCLINVGVGTITNGTLFTVRKWNRLELEATECTR
jgi:hypothetical protein